MEVLVEQPRAELRRCGTQSGLLVLSVRTDFAPSVAPDTSHLFFDVFRLLFFGDSNLTDSVVSLIDARPTAAVPRLSSGRVFSDYIFSSSIRPCSVDRLHEHNFSEDRMPD